MSRPRLCRRVRLRPRSFFFKPRGVPLRHLEIITLTREEAEALRLKDVEDLDQNECAKRMKTSQSTFQRILSSAHKKTSAAIVRGKAIEISPNP
jgi:predicted DNA-binding protein (UPF0251 family)